MHFDLIFICKHQINYNYSDLRSIICFLAPLWVPKWDVFCVGFLVIRKLVPETRRVFIPSSQALELSFSPLCFVCMFLAKWSTFTKLMLIYVYLRISRYFHQTRYIDTYSFRSLCSWSLTELMIFNLVYYNPDVKSQWVLDTWIVLINIRLF